MSSEFHTSYLIISLLDRHLSMVIRKERIEVEIQDFSFAS